MEVKLKVLRGPNEGKEISLRESKFLIGRSEDCDLRPNSDTISRHHCVIIVEQSYIELRDFGSKNGTYVNGDRVSAPRELRPGDVLRAGPLEFEVVISQRVGGKRRTKVKGVADVAARTASGVPRSGDKEIDDWLEKPKLETSEKERQPQTLDNPLGETQTLSAGDTSIIPTQKPATPAVPVASPTETTTEVIRKDESPGSSKSSRSKDKKKPGKLPPLPKHLHKDSSNAAADVLRGMMRRR